MFKFFYSDCVISEVTQTGSTRNVAKAVIDGRAVDKISLSPEMYSYFTGIGKGTKNRVWFHVMNFFGKKLLSIIAVENAAGERLLEPFSLKNKIQSLTIQPACLGFLTWFAAWVVVGIPWLAMGGDAFNINVTLIFASVVAGVLFWFASLVYLFKRGTLNSWMAGDLSAYTKAVKPVFGAGLADLKR
jgi:hypothetical protein